MIDTYESVNTLKEGGFTDKQAESLIKVLKNFVTRDDLLRTENDIKKNINNLENDIKKNINNLENDIKKDMKSLELGITIKISGIVFILLMAFKILEKFA